jgi:hypothetical protein
MKLKILLAALFVAGIVTAFAVAAPPPGKGNPHKQGTSSTTDSTSTSTSTTSTTEGRKVTLCHRTGNGRFVKITVAKSAVAAHLRHGDVVGSDCSKPTPTTTDTTATTVATTTA